MNARKQALYYQEKPVIKTRVDYDDLASLVVADGVNDARVASC